MVIFFVLLGLYSISSSFADEIKINAGKFFSNCDYVGTEARVQITGAAARKLFKTLEEGTEETFNDQKVRYTENIWCEKRDNLHRCFFILASNGTFSAPQRQLQQQLQPIRSPVDVVTNEPPQDQQQNQQEQAPQQQCTLSQIIFN
tara:strand:- start:280 stop:717 length:438 start_codon:yes stop_codon:yes gene_type:complete